MGLRRGPKHKLSRRFGIDIFGTGGAALQCRLDTQPGQHARERPRRRISEYGLQLREKQKVKAIYGVSERQFRVYVAEALRQPGTWVCTQQADGAPDGCPLSCAVNGRRNTIPSVRAGGVRGTRFRRSG